MELREWQYMNKSAANSSSYKKRFTKLINYHISHASSELERIVRKAIKDDGFFLGEHYNNGSDEFDRDIIVNIDKNNDWSFSVLLDGKETAHETGNGWEDLIRALSFYFETPDVGTEDYDDLLTESLNEWQLMNSPKATQTASSKTNKEKFTELVAYIQKHKNSSAIFTTVSVPTDTGFEYEEQRAFEDGSEHSLSIEVSLGKHNLFTIYVDVDGQRKTLMANGWEEFLRYLKNYFNVPSLGTPEHKSLTESASIAEDFKIYENLWENI